MKITPINTNQQCDFKAQLHISGSKILKKNEIAKLQQKVAQIGTENDMVLVHVGKLDRQAAFKRINRTMFVVHQLEIPMPSYINLGWELENNEKLLKKPFKVIDNCINKMKKSYECTQV